MSTTLFYLFIQFVHALRSLRCVRNFIDKATKLQSNITEKRHTVNSYDGRQQNLTVRVYRIWLNFPIRQVILRQRLERRYSKAKLKWNRYAHANFAQIAKNVSAVCCQRCFYLCREEMRSAAISRNSLNAVRPMQRTKCHRVHPAGNWRRLIVIITLLPL